MNISDRGLDIIRRSEGLRLEAYLCPAGVWTIGYGHTGRDVAPGMVITVEQADELLKQDVERFERAVDDAVKVPVSQGMFDALVSFTFNLGEGNLRKSTLLKRLNAGKIAETANEFRKWNKVNRKVLPGLTARRELERKLFLS